MERCCGLLMVFGRNLRIWTPFLEVRGDAQSWLMARWKAHGQLSIRLNWTFFAIYHGSGVMKLCNFRRGSTSLHSNFIRTGSSPINNSWHQKTRDTGLPDGKDRIPLRSFVLTQYRSLTDRRTDGRICRNIYSACKASFVERCKNGQFRNGKG